MLFIENLLSSVRQKGTLVNVTLYPYIEERDGISNNERLREREKEIFKRRRCPNCESDMKGFDPDVHIIIVRQSTDSLSFSFSLLSPS